MDVIIFQMIIYIILKLWFNINLVYFLSDHI